MPYRYYDDSGCSPQGFVNDLSLIFDRNLFTQTDTKEIFFQRDIEKRRQALLGIIISDTNPDRPLLKPMRFDLTLENLDEVFKRLQDAGYFAQIK